MILTIRFRSYIFILMAMRSDFLTSLQSQASRLSILFP